MLRCIRNAFRSGLQAILIRNVESTKPNLINELQYRSFGFLTQKVNNLPTISTNYKSITVSEHISKNLLQPCQPIQIPMRTLIKFSRRKGKRKSVKAVLRRFKRLHWGGWIRTLAGRRRYAWCKSRRERERAKQHFLCNGKQNWLLDTMVTSFWRRPKYYVDDPYEPYHTRNHRHCKKTPYE